MSKTAVRSPGNSNTKAVLAADQAALEAIAASIAENKRLAFMVVQAWLNKNGLVLMPKGWLNKNGLVSMPQK